MKGQRKRLAELAKDGVYPTPTQEAELIREGMEEYGLIANVRLDNLITNTSERRVQDADPRADKALANPNLGPISKDDFDSFLATETTATTDVGSVPEAICATPLKLMSKKVWKYSVLVLLK